MFLCQGPGGSGGGFPQPLPLRYQPVLETPRLGYVESLEERSPVEVQRVGPPALLQGGAEFQNVDIHGPRLDTDLYPSPTHDEVVGKMTPQKAEALGERVPGAGFVSLRPEEGEKRVPAVEGSGTGDREIDQESKTLRLRQDGGDLLPVRPQQIEGAQGSERQRPISGFIGPVLDFYSSGNI